MSAKEIAALLASLSLSGPRGPQYKCDSHAPSLMAGRSKYTPQQPRALTEDEKKRNAEIDARNEAKKAAKKAAKEKKHD